jgi:hypothetical protein
MPDDTCWSERSKQALATLNVQIQTHERYHTQKENLTWLATAAYLGATMLLVGREAFWKSWPLSAFLCWLALLLLTAAAVLVFLQSQFRARHVASAFFVAASDTAASWVHTPPIEADLQPKALRELDDMLVSCAVERRFREVVNGRSSPPQRVALTLSVLWSFAAAVFIIGTYTGCRSL